MLVVKWLGLGVSLQSVKGQGAGDLRRIDRAFGVSGLYTLVLGGGLAEKLVLTRSSKLLGVFSTSTLFNFSACSTQQ